MACLESLVYAQVTLKVCGLASVQNEAALHAFQMLDGSKATYSCGAEPLPQQSQR